MKSGDTVLDTVREAVQDVAPTVELTDDLSLIAARVIDSLSLLRVVSRLERDLDVHIEDRDIMPANFESISAIRAFLAGKGR